MWEAQDRACGLVVKYPPINPQLSDLIIEVIWSWGSDQRIGSSTCGFLTWRYHWEDVGGGAQLRELGHEHMLWKGICCPLSLSCFSPTLCFLDAMRGTASVDCLLSTIIFSLTSCPSDLTKWSRTEPLKPKTKTNLWSFKLFISGILSQQWVSTSPAIRTEKWGGK